MYRSTGSRKNTEMCIKLILFFLLFFEGVYQQGGLLTGARGYLLLVFFLRFPSGFEGFGGTGKVSG